MNASKSVELPAGMMQLLSDAEKYTVKLIRTQQQLLDADVARPRDLQRSERPNSKRKQHLGNDESY